MKIMKILLFWKILLFYDTMSLAGSEQALFTPKHLFFLRRESMLLHFSSTLIECL